MSLESTNHGSVKIGGTEYPVLEIWKGASEYQGESGVKRNEFSKDDDLGLPPFLSVVDHCKPRTGETENLVDDHGLFCLEYAEAMFPLPEFGTDEIHIWQSSKEKVMERRGLLSQNFTRLTTGIIAEMYKFSQVYSTIIKKGALPILVEHFNKLMEDFEVCVSNTQPFENKIMSVLQSVIWKFFMSITVEFYVSYELVHELMSNLEDMFVEACIDGMYLEALDKVLVHLKYRILILELPKGKKRRHYEWLVDKTCEEVEHALLNIYDDDDDDDYEFFYPDDDHDYDGV